MKIAFCNQHHYYGGLNNDGGSRTIIKSVNALKNLGHKAFVVTGSDRHTWLLHDKPLSKIPDNTDVCVAVSASAVMPMLKSSPPKAKKVWWMRGLERWQMPEENILSRARKLNMLVNSSWLQMYLMSHGISSQVCFAGMDLDFWQDQHLRRRQGTTIGCLYNASHRTKRWKDFRVLKQLLGQGRYRYVAFGNVAPTSNYEWLTQFEKRPSPMRLRTLYSGCNVWFAPTTLEGFHNVAAEAALCGCVVACYNRGSNGMGDYANADTALIGNDIEAIADLIAGMTDESERVKRMQARLHEIGDRKKNMSHFVEVLREY